MILEEIYKELDAMPYLESENYLTAKIDQATKEGNYDIVIPLLNELIGFLRDTTQFEKGLVIKERLLGVLEQLGQMGTMNYATSLLNIANFDRALGQYDESLSEYEACVKIYEQLLPKGDYLWAGLHNNLSLLYQMKGDNLAAIGELVKALEIVQELPGREMEVATTYTNIAQSLAALGQMEEAEENVNEALRIFAEGGNEDYHFSAASAVKGIIEYNKGNYREAAAAYEAAGDMVLKVMGDNDNYKLLMSNRDAMLALIPDSGDREAADMADTSKVDDIKGLALCKAYYEKYGAPMITSKFGEYEERIAVGHFGEGSDCYGYDDEFSRDHDWGPGFSMWVTKDTYRLIGKDLEEAYELLPDTFMGYTRHTTPEGKHRVGVHIIEEIKLDVVHLERNGEEALAEFINGEIWRDDEGVISKLRAKVGEYYGDSEKVWLTRLAQNLILMGQTGQYNLKRALDRGDKIGATVYLARYYEHALRTLFTLNKKYAPYEKWLMRAASDLDFHPEITDCLKAIADMDITDERVGVTIELIAQIVLQALKELGVMPEDEGNWYLEQIGKRILMSVEMM